MYYNRTISNSFSILLEKGGALEWLFQFVKNREDLDFLIGKNTSKEWISIYRGLTRIISISLSKNNFILIDADVRYKKLSSNLFGKKNINQNFQNEIEDIIIQIERNSKFDRYYKNKKEGYYQNELSRRYGICCYSKSDFVILDKEAVIGYSNKAEKDKIFGNVQQKYRLLQQEISDFNDKRFGKNLNKKALGNELDFLALDKYGNILLIEYKHGTNTSGIYLSPLQIGLYFDVFSIFPKKELENSVFEMLEQKQKIGLINPDWKKPKHIREIIPVLIISEYNYNSSAKTKYNEVLQFTREKLSSKFLSNIETFNITLENGLTKW